MRSGTWILALCGVVGLALGIVTAADWNSSRPKKSAGKEPLFENAAAEFEAQEVAKADDSVEAKGTLQYFSRNGQISGQPAPSRYVRARDSFADEPRPIAAETGAREITGLPRSAANDLVNAAYETPQTEPPSGRIRPVHALGENDVPFEAAHVTNAAPDVTTAAQAARSALADGTRSVPATLEAAVGPQTPTVTVQWVKRSDINVGQECECDLLVKNSGEVPAREVTVEAFFPTSVRLTKAEPQPVEDRDRLSWKFDSLDPGEKRTIHISMIPTRRGELATTAHVRFTGSAAGLFRVEEPLLKIAVEGPAEVMAGDPASQVVTVSNPGSGVAHNVSVEAIIPKGLEHPRGERLVTAIGSLSPGESRTVRLALAAVEGGLHHIKVEATADADLRQIAEAKIHVVAPSLKIALDGPGLRYMGRNAAYRLTVLNDGAAASNNVRVVHKVPEGFTFVEADKGGKFDSAAETINWFVGRLEAGQSAELNVDLAAAKLGDFVHVAGVISEQGSAAEARFETRVDGSASLVLETLDLDDPVEVGRETAYEIRVRNEGTKAANNVGVSCELPVGVQLVSAKGPADHIVENGLVIFRSLPELAPGKTALYRVHVRGTTEGNHRFRARLASDSIQEPLIFEELTKFYKD